MASIGEFFVKIGIKTETTELQKFRNDLFKFTAIGTGLYFAIDKAVKSSAELYRNIYNINKQTGLSRKGMLKFQNAVQMTNPQMTSEESLNNIKDLEMSLAKIRLLRGNVSPFQMLGIQIEGQNAFDIIKQLREILPKFTEGDIAKGTSILSNMGIDPGIINLILASKKEYENAMKAPFITLKQQNKILAIEIALKKINLELKYSWDLLISKLSPVIEGFFNVVSSGLENIKIILSSIFNISDDWFLSLNDKKGILIGFLIGITTYFYPITVLIGAIFLAVDELFQLFTGGESAIGDWFTWLYDELLNIKDVIASIKTLWDAIWDKDISVGRVVKYIWDGTPLNEKGKERQEKNKKDIFLSDSDHLFWWDKYIYEGLNKIGEGWDYMMGDNLSTPPVTITNNINIQTVPEEVANQTVEAVEYASVNLHMNKIGAIG